MAAKDREGDQHGCQDDSEDRHGAAAIRGLEECPLPGVGLGQGELRPELAEEVQGEHEDHETAEHEVAADDGAGAGAEVPLADLGVEGPDLGLDVLALGLAGQFAAEGLDLRRRGRIGDARLDHVDDHERQHGEAEYCGDHRGGSDGAVAGPRHCLGMFRLDVIKTHHDCSPCAMARRAAIASGLRSSRPTGHDP